MWFYPCCTITAVNCVCAFWGCIFDGRLAAATHGEKSQLVAFCDQLTFFVCQEIVLQFSARGIIMLLTIPLGKGLY